MTAGGEGHSPLTQFEIQPWIPFHVGQLDLSFSNSALFMVLASALITFFMLWGTRRHALVPGRVQSMVELSYEFIASMLRDNVGPEGRRFFPFIFSMFMFVLFGNLLGMMPYSFTFTSHIAVTFFMAVFIILGVIVLGFVYHGLHFLKFFVPHGVPAPLLPLIVPIEIFSFFVRPVSLSIRLAANMTAGHILLKVFAGFVLSMGIFGVLPLAFMVLLTGFEFFVAVLQAYIFTILTCVYLNDAVNMH